MNDRRTAFLVAGVSALLAAGLIFLFVSHYHKNTPAPVVVTPQDSTVLLAKQPIPAGTPESEIVSAGMLAPSHVPQSEVVAGAINDTAVVAGEATSVAIPVGQQITAGDFTKTPINAITPFLKGDQRGVAFSLDAEHGLTGFLQPNSTVDIMATTPAGGTQLLLKDVTVINNGGGLVVLRLTDKQALIVTAATLNHSLWLAMRPTAHATNSVKVGTVGADPSNG